MTTSIVLITVAIIKKIAINFLTILIIPIVLTYLTASVMMLIVYVVVLSIVQILRET